MNYGISHSVVMTAVGCTVLALGIATMMKGKGCKTSHFTAMSWLTTITGVIVGCFGVLGLIKKGLVPPTTLALYNIAIGLWVTLLGFGLYQAAKAPVTPGGACSKVKDEAYGVMGVGVVALLIGIVMFVMSMKK